MLMDSPYIDWEADLVDHSHLLMNCTSGTKRKALAECSANLSRAVRLRTGNESVVIDNNNNDDEISLTPPNAPPSPKADSKPY